MPLDLISVGEELDGKVGLNKQSNIDWVEGVRDISEEVTTEKNQNSEKGRKEKVLSHSRVVLIYGYKGEIRKVDLLKRLHVYRPFCVFLISERFLTFVLIFYGSIMERTYFRRKKE